LTSFIIDLSKIVCERVIASSDPAVIRVKQALRPDHRAVSPTDCERSGFVCPLASGLTR